MVEAIQLYDHICHWRVQYFAFNYTFFYQTKFFSLITIIGTIKSLTNKIYEHICSYNKQSRTPKTLPSDM